MTGSTVIKVHLMLKKTFGYLIGNLHGFKDVIRRKEAEHPASALQNAYCWYHYLHTLTPQTFLEGIHCPTECLHATYEVCEVIGLIAAAKSLESCWVKKCQCLTARSDGLQEIMKMKQRKKKGRPALICMSFLRAMPLLNMCAKIAYHTPPGPVSAP